MGLTYTGNKEAHYVIVAAGFLFEAKHKGLENSTNGNVCTLMQRLKK